MNWDVEFNYIHLGMLLQEDTFLNLIIAFLGGYIFSGIVLISSNLEDVYRQIL